MDKLAILYNYFNVNEDPVIIGTTGVAATDLDAVLLEFCVDDGNYVEIFATAAINVDAGGYVKAVELLKNGVVVARDTQSVDPIPLTGEETSFTIFYKDVAVDNLASGVSTYTLNLIYDTLAIDSGNIEIPEK